MSAITKYDPSNFSELREFSEIMAGTAMVPNSFRGKPDDIVAAVIMGGALGLNPMQALQNIAVINGKPTVWGDALLAIVQGHPAFGGIKEWVENVGTDSAVAHCSVVRIVRGEKETTTRSFGVFEAQRANLWKNPKRPPWCQYPERMLQMRARSFACRDAFADALKGISSAEEVSDYNNEPVKVQVVKHPALDAVVPSATSTSVVDAEYVMCDEQPKAAPGLIPLSEVPAKPAPKKKKPTNKDRCLDAIKLYKKDFEVEQEDLLQAAGIKTLEKVSNKQITWLIDTYKKLKTKAITPAEVFGKNKTPDLPPVPPVPSSGIEDAQL